MEGGEKSAAPEKTEKRDIKDALWEIEQKYNSLVEAINDWVWEIDNNCVYTYASPNIIDLLGYEPEDVIGKKPYDFMQLEEAKRAEILFNEVAKTGRPFTGIEKVNQHKGGWSIIVETSGSPILDKTGKIIGYRGVDRDITERKNFEKAVAMSEKLYSSVINTCRDGIYLVQDDIIKYLNPAFCELLEYEEEELIGKPFDTVCPIEIAGEVSNVLEKGENPVEVVDLYDSILIKKEGERIPVEVRAGLIDYDGKPAFLGFVRDRTRTKKMETQLLEILLRLQQSEKRRVEFLDVVAHELRTPLTAIKTYIQMMKIGNFGKFEPEDDAHLESLMKSADKLNLLINEMLDSSKIEFGKIKLKKENIDIMELTVEVLEEVQPLIDHKNQNLKLNTSKPIQIIADYELMKKVVTNLIGNANKYTSRNGDINITISSSKDEIHFQIQDSGMGISEEEIPFVFDRFFIGGKTLSGEHSQLGLGLAITKAIVEQHDGKIWVESKEGEGSTFHFILPIEDKE
jgi:PAS domain S-box-containing protein